MSKLTVVVGGAFGSEAKGAVTARVARIALRNDEKVTVVRVAGHNAGHTAYDDKDRAWALRTVPVAMVVDPDVVGYIAAGSELNPDVLTSEVEELEAAGIGIRHRLYVDRAATWIDDEHIAREGGLKMHENSGSTAKGVGAARADRIMRTARTIGEWGGLDTVAIGIDNSGVVLRELADDAESHVIIEGTQGYGLGVHTSFYPLTTSSDCRAIDFLAMAGIDPTAFREYRVWVVARRFPIRVAGPSGPLKGETTWDELDLPEERTTVTKKVRRVGEWDGDLVAEAVEANGGGRVVRVAYTMLDQAMPWVKGLNGDIEGVLEPEDLIRLGEHLRTVESQVGAQIGLIGTGPNSMIEVSA